MSEGKKVHLILEDGTRFEGKSFGAEKSVSGEVVFNTAMVGYPESMTDSSYKGQIMVATYPLVGNYGVPGEDYDGDLMKFYESEGIKVLGLVISDYSFEHSHWNAETSLSNWMKKYDIPGVYGIDTRALTKILREKGTMVGKLVLEDADVEWHDANKDNVVEQVSTKEVIEYGDGDYKVVLVDCGTKNNIIRCLVDRGAKVIRVPYDYDFSQIEYDGLFIANGPGDPKMCAPTIKHLAKALEEDRPIFGICLGSQLMALAAGADTYKLKYGHRSHNQPVIQVGTKKCYVTSQNHGYAVNNDTLPKGWSPYFINLNDDTCEGIRHESKPFFSTQFHPEATSGPTDTEYLFDEFMNRVKEYKK